MTLNELRKDLPTIKKQLDGGEKKIVVIAGSSGPTGKTSAARMLRASGIDAYEEYEVIHIVIDAF